MISYPSLSESCLPVLGWLSIFFLFVFFFSYFVLLVSLFYQLSSLLLVKVGDLTYWIRAPAEVIS